MNQRDQAIFQRIIAYCKRIQAYIETYHRDRGAFFEQFILQDAMRHVPCADW